jgi:hypothetical protein
MVLGRTALGPMPQVRLFCSQDFTGYLSLTEILQKPMTRTLDGNGEYLMLAVVVPLYVLFSFIIGRGIKLPYNVAFRLVAFLRQRQCHHLP